MTGSSTARATIRDARRASRRAGSPRRPGSRGRRRSTSSRWRSRGSPGALATTRALAASQALTRTSGSGAACRRRSSSAFSRCVLMSGACELWWTPPWGISGAGRRVDREDLARRARGTGRRRGGRGRRARSRPCVDQPRQQREQRLAVARLVEDVGRRARGPTARGRAAARARSRRRAAPRARGRCGARSRRSSRSSPAPSRWRSRAPPATAAARLGSPSPQPSSTRARAPAAPARRRTAPAPARSATAPPSRAGTPRARTPPR